MTGFAVGVAAAPLLLATLCAAALQPPPPRRAPGHVMSGVRIRAAGVVPYAHLPGRTGIAFLLQEMSNGTRAGKLSDFGGRCESDDDDAFATAARELGEETDFAFGSVEEVADQLRSERKRVTLIHTSGKYVCFFLKVPYVPPGMLPKVDTTAEDSVARDFRWHRADELLGDDDSKRILERLLNAPPNADKAQAENAAPVVPAVAILSSFQRSVLSVLAAENAQFEMKERWHSTVDRVIAAAQARKEQLEKLDTDGDGSISIEEWLAAGEAENAAADAAAVELKRAAAKAEFKRIDIDGDGVITEAEFLAASSSGPEETPARRPKSRSRRVDAEQKRRRGEAAREVARLAVERQQKADVAQIWRWKQKQREEGTGDDDEDFSSVLAAVQITGGRRGATGINGRPATPAGKPGRGGGRPQQGRGKGEPARASRAERRDAFMQRRREWQSAVDEQNRRNRNKADYPGRLRERQAQPAAERPQRQQQPQPKISRGRPAVRERERYDDDEFDFQP